MISNTQKVIIFYFFIFGIYFFINIPLIINSAFLADDLPIIFFSQKTPNTLFTFWENGLTDLIPSAKFESFRYRPFTSFVFYALFSTLGLKAPLWALVSQLNHIANFILLIFIFRKIQRLFNYPDFLSYILPVFYLFYPGNVTNVAWASGRIDLIVIFFCLLSFYFSIKYIEKQKISFLAYSLILFFIATLTKENSLGWVIVELFLLWQIYYLLNRPPEAFKALLKLFKSKVSICILYIFMRSIIAGLSNNELLKNAGIASTFFAFIKSLLFALLPVDSGTFIYSYQSSGIIFLTLCVIYFCALGLIFFFCLSGKNLFKNIAVILCICLATLIFYSIAGGGMYRLFPLTLVSILISVFILSAYKKTFDTQINYPVKIASVVLFVFFVFGFHKISDYWLLNYSLEEESLNSLINIYDKDKVNIILDYPHALAQTYCYSDIGTYLYFKVNGKLGRFDNIYELAAINSHSGKNFIKGNEIEKINNSFILTSEFNDTYFSPGAFFTEKSELGQKYTNLKNFSFEVLKLNSFSRPLSIKLTPEKDFENASFIKFLNGKFEKL